MPQSINIEDNSSLSGTANTERERTSAHVAGHVAQTGVVICDGIDLSELTAMVTAF